MISHFVSEIDFKSLPYYFVQLFTNIINTKQHSTLKYLIVYQKLAICKYYQASENYGI